MHWNAAIQGCAAKRSDKQQQHLPEIWEWVKRNALASVRVCVRAYVCVLMCVFLQEWSWWSRTSIRSSVVLASPQLLGLTGGDMSTYGGSCCFPNVSYAQHFALNWNQKSDFVGCNRSDDWLQLRRALLSLSNKLYETWTNVCYIVQVLEKSYDWRKHWVISTMLCWRIESCFPPGCTVKTGYTLAHQHLCLLTDS